jgi:hypothetical protein|tara:strand:+ start:2341 stop:2595 length:255 start_codon:yes stop_codon:yes gene_type:complete
MNKTDLELDAEYTKSVISKLEEINKELGNCIESGEVNLELFNLSKWHEDHLIDYTRLVHCALPNHLQYLIPSTIKFEKRFGNYE